LSQTYEKRLGKCCKNKAALKKVNKRLAELEKLLQAAFERAVLGAGDSDNAGTPDIFISYAQKYEAEKQELTQKAAELPRSIKQQSQTENDVNIFIALMKKYSNITELDRATAVELIDYITVSAKTTLPREIVIHYNLLGDVE